MIWCHYWDKWHVLLSEQETWLSCLYFDIYEIYKFHIKENWLWKSFVNLRTKYLLTIAFKHCAIWYGQFQIQMGILFVGLFDLILYIFNQQLFSCVGTGLHGLNQYWAIINVSCSRTQHSDVSEARNCSPLNKKRKWYQKNQDFMVDFKSVDNHKSRLSIKL